MWTQIESKNGGGLATRLEKAVLIGWGMQLINELKVTQCPPSLIDHHGNIISCPLTRDTLIDHCQLWVLPTNIKPNIKHSEPILLISKHEALPAVFFQILCWVPIFVWVLINKLNVVVVIKNSAYIHGVLIFYRCLLSQFMVQWNHQQHMFKQSLGY